MDFLIFFPVKENLNSPLVNILYTYIHYYNLYNSVNVFPSIHHKKKNQNQF